MAQDTTPAIVCYQGTGSQTTFDVPFDKGYYGEVKVLFVRRGLADYTYYPSEDDYVVNGRLYAWINGTTKVYTHTPNPAVSAKTYDAQDVKQEDTVSATAGQTITVDGVVYSRSQSNDISSNLKLTWNGDMLEVGDFICIIRDTERGQPYILPNNQKHIERALDNLERQIQEVKDATDVSLKVDPSYDIEDSHKMNPVAWLETILRCVDKSVRALRYANGWLDYSFDDPNIADADKTWTHLLSAENVKNIRERSVVVDGQTLYYAEYLSSDGTWRMFADTPATVNTKVDKAGDTMTGTLVHAYGSHSKYLSSNDTNKYMDVYMNGDIFTLYYHYTNSSTATLSMRSYVDGHFNIYPSSDKGGTIGFPSRRFEKIYTTHLCGSTNGNNYLIVPDVGHSDTIATKSQVDLAANSGSQLYTTGVWYAKMYAATVVPTGAEYDGRNYADFSQVDSDNNPVIKIYTGASGAWTLTETITPPATYNGYMTITSKIWDIAEQSGQQGGQVLWDYTHKTFTPYPRIVSFESINITGNSTVIMPDNPTNNSIVNKKYVDDATAGSGYHPDLFDVKWADHELNDIQWLRADTFSWQDGGVYEAAYNHLADDISGKSLSSETIAGVTVQFYLADDGHKICPDSQESNVAAIYAATGVAWYYILDTTNQRFKLPRTKFGFTGIRSGVGKFVDAGLPNITGSISGLEGDGLSSSGAIQHTTWSGGEGGGSRKWVGLTFDASRSSSIYGGSDTVQPPATEMYLYFYVGNFTQTALENTAGLNAELFNGKADANFVNTDMIDYVVEKQDPSAGNNYTWYRKYKSGWVEQGGLVESTNTDYKEQTISLPIEMANERYTVSITPMTGYTGTMQARGYSYYLPTTTNFKVAPQAKQYTWGNCWEVKGIAAN